MMANGTKFIASALTDMSPAAYNDAGTVIIRRKRIVNTDLGTNSGNGLRITGTTNLILENSLVGPTVLNGVSIETSTGNHTIKNNVFNANRCGIEIASSSGNSHIEDNDFLNPWGAPQCAGQAVQIEDCTTADTYIRRNHGLNQRGRGHTEDWISLFNSTGTTNPIRVEDNAFWGGGPSPSGGGIMTGDNGGGNQRVANNKLYEPGNYIYAASGGEDIEIVDNKGYQTDVAWANIAMYAYNVDAPTCDNITVTGNWVYIEPNATYPSGNYWYAPGGAEDCGTITGTAFVPANTTGITLAQLAMPERPMRKLSDASFWLYSEEANQFREVSGSCDVAQLPIPVADAGTDQSINISTATLSGSATGSSGYTYRWVQERGPNAATMSAATSATNNLSGLVDGVYVFRLHAVDGDGAEDTDLIIITVLLT